MRYLVIILFFASSSLVAQQDNKFLSNFILGDQLKEKNDNYKYQTADFSHLWKNTDNHLVKGVIGSSHQRIRIVFTSVKQDAEELWSFHVVGKSKVKSNVCDFTGQIRVDSVFEVKSMHYGVDDMYRDSSIVSQGVLFATYEFNESRDQSHSGMFSGKLMTKWYTNTKGELKYDNIQRIADGYMNNAFIGIWTQYGAKKSKVCNWADHRIPHSAQDFDIGAGEFSPSEKYYEFGWEQYQKAWLYGDEEAKRKELAKWWK